MRGRNEYNDHSGNFGNGNAGDEITHVALRGVRTMINPFQYGGVVTEESFCNRKKELAEVLRVMENSGRAFLYSERRFGKTSLVQLALRKLKKKDYLSVYIDVWPTDGELSFIEEMAKAVAKSFDTRADKALLFAKIIFQRLTPSLTVDDDGKPMLAFGVTKQTSFDQELEEVLEAPAILDRSDERALRHQTIFQQVSSSI